LIRLSPFFLSGRRILVAKRFAISDEELQIESIGANTFV